MHIDFVKFLGAVTSVEHEHLRVTLAVLQSDRDERDFLSCWLDQHRDQAFSSNQRFPEFFLISKRPRLHSACAEKNTRRPDYPLSFHEPHEVAFCRISPQHITYREYRLLTVTLAILRSRAEDSEFLSWWLHDFGVPAASSDQPDPQTEDDIEEQRLLLESLGIDCSD